MTARIFSVINSIHRVPESLLSFLFPSFASLFESQEWEMPVINLVDVVHLLSFISLQLRSSKNLCKRTRHANKVSLVKVIQLGQDGGNVHGMYYIEMWCGALFLGKSRIWAYSRFHDGYRQRWSMWGSQHCRIGQLFLYVCCPSLLCLFQQDTQVHKAEEEIIAMLAFFESRHKPSQWRKRWMRDSCVMGEIVKLSTFTTAVQSTILTFSA